MVDAGRTEVERNGRAGFGVRCPENVSQRLEHRYRDVRPDDLIILIESMYAASGQFPCDTFPRPSRSYLRLLRDVRAWCAYNERFSSEQTLVSASLRDYA